MSFEISIFRDDFVFSSGHVMLYGENSIEASHGHNYKLGAVIKGTVDENGLLVDFRDFKNILREEIKILNQKFMIPSNPSVVTAEHDDMLSVSFLGKKLLEIQAHEAVHLPVRNTSSELLCQYISDNVIKQLSEADKARVESISIIIEECYGQKAQFTQVLAV